MSVAFYQSNRVFLLDHIREINRKQAEAYGRQLDGIFFRASYASAVIADRGRVQSYVVGSDGDRAAALELESSIVELLQMFTRATSEITSIYVHSAARDRIVTDRLATPVAQFHDKGWLSYLAEAEPTRPFLVYREDPVIRTPMITLVRRMEEAGRLAGGILVNMEIEHLRRLVGRGALGPGERIYVVTEGERVVFSTSDEGLGGSPATHLEPLFLAHASGTLFNLDYYLYSGSDYFDEKTARLRRHLVVLLGTVLLVGAGVSAVLAGFAYRPIREIVDTIQHPDRHPEAALLGGAREGAADEVRFIEDAIIRMMASNRRLEERLAERFNSLSRAHYAALQLQINPHFLYNTLESIYWNCMEAFEAAHPVPTSVLALSRFLRMVIATEAMAIPLSEEIEITEQYVTLLRLRYENRLEVDWSIPPELRSMSVPKLVLQPLVENAFYHGIKPLRRSGTVTIGARREGPALVLNVTDDGVGMSARRLVEIRSMLTAEKVLSEDHIGLSNVAQRMRILFDRSARVEILSSEGTGTTVSIVMPAEPAALEHDKLTLPM